MAQSRDDRIYLAYKLAKASFLNENLDRPHARALLYIGQKFGVSPLRVQRVVSERVGKEKSRTT